MSVWTHVNQFTSIGGIQAGIKNNALSVDHLEVMEEQDIQDLIQLFFQNAFSLNLIRLPVQQ